MTLARIVAASVFALGVLTLITIRLVATRAARRRIARSVALAAGIADERRGPWLFAEDTTPDEDDEPTAVLESHPSWRDARDDETPGQLEPQLIDPPRMKSIDLNAVPPQTYTRLTFDTEDIDVDPPVPGWYLLAGDRVIGYAPPDAFQPDTTMPPVIVTPPPAAPEWTTVGGYRVHAACAEKHDQRQKVTDGCAEFLVHSGGTA